MIEGKENSPTTSMEVLRKRKKAIIPPKSRRVDNLEMPEEYTIASLRELNPGYYTCWDELNNYNHKIKIFCLLKKR